MARTSSDPIMKTISLLILFLGAALSAAAQRPQGVGSNLVDVAVVGSDLVGIANDGGVDDSDGRVLRSTDGGKTFTELFTVPVAGDQLHALGVSGNVVIVSGTDSELYRADFDVDPTAWTTVSPPFGTLGGLSDLAANGAVWVAAGETSLRSTDNGLSWSLTTPTDTRGAAYNSADGGWLLVGGLFNGQAHRSTDGGATWTASGLPAGTPLLSAVAADGFGNALAVGEGGTFLMSTDNGQTFTFANLGGATVSENLLDVVSTGENGWLVGGDQRTLFKLEGGAFDTVLEGDASGGDTRGLALLDGAVVMAGVGVVPAPVISAPDSPSALPVEVTIIPDASTESTFYTLDGSEPETGAVYASPFAVTDTVTVRAVSQIGGVYSPVASLPVEGGDPQPFSLDSIALSGTDVVITQDLTDAGVVYELQYTPDLAADPAVWTPESVDTRTGDGNPLAWTVPAPAVPRIWRAVIVVE